MSVPSVPRGSLSSDRHAVDASSSHDRRRRPRPDGGDESAGRAGVTAGATVVTPACGCARRAAGGSSPPRRTRARGPRSPAQGGGSSMCSTSSPRSAITLMYRLSGRCMKGNLTPGATSSMVCRPGGRGRPASTAPRGCGRRSSRCPGVCSSGWFRKRTKRPPGASTRAISSMAGSNGSMCSSTRHTTTASNAAERNGRRRGRRPGVGGARRARPGPRRSGPRVGSMPDHLGAERGDPAGELALTAADVEHPPRPGEVRVDEREDLLLVLGVGAVGEVLLPPPGVSFPLPRRHIPGGSYFFMSPLPGRYMAHGRVVPHRVARTSAERAGGGRFVLRATVGPRPACAPLSPSDPRRPRLALDLLLPVVRQRPPSRARQ